MEKDLEGLAKPVGLGYSCAGDLGTSQKEEAKEMGAGAQMRPTASYGRKPPSSVSRGRGSPVLLSITQSGFPGPQYHAVSCPLLPGPHGGEGGSGSKLAAHPLSHLFLAVFHALQIHLSFPTSQIRSLLIHSVTWGKSLLYP